MKKKYIYGILIVIWICIIFSFSLQASDKSSLLSDGVGALILEHASSETIQNSQSWTKWEWNMFHTVIRKCGHFAEFFILGILMMLNMNLTKVHKKYLIGIFLCMIVASMDESIQLFVPGRAGLITDVMLDTFGSVVGLFVCVLGHKVWRRRNG